MGIQAATVDDLPETPRILFNIFAKNIGATGSPVNPTDTEGAYIDVRDVARAHVDAHTRDELGGNSRLILSSKSDVTFQDYCALYAINARAYL